MSAMMYLASASGSAWHSGTSIETNHDLSRSWSEGSRGTSITWIADEWVDRRGTSSGDECPTKRPDGYKQQIWPQRCSDFSVSKRQSHSVTVVCGYQNFPIFVPLTRSPTRPSDWRWHLCDLSSGHKFPSLSSEMLSSVNPVKGPPAQLNQPSTKAHPTRYSRSDMTYIREAH